MPRLTQIKETKKGRLALFLDGEFAFSLDEDTFAAAALHQDDELEDWQIEELRKKSETRRVKRAPKAKHAKQRRARRLPKV